jgi:L-amino acid N-acyltransferase YncA
MSRSADISIREVRPDDAAAVARILNRIIEAGTFTVFDAPFSVEAERAYIERLPVRGVFLVAERAADGRIVGFQSMEPFAAFTRAFDHVGVLGTYVDLDERRQGIASRLFAATFEAARQKGYRKIFTYVRADNPAALSTYRQHGFTIVGTARRQAKIGARFVDEIIIERWLD